MLKQLPIYLVFWILRSVGIECEFEEVKKGKYFPIEGDNNSPESLEEESVLNSQIDGKIILDELKERYGDLEHRRDQLTSKGQAMLTIGGLMVPLFVYVMSLTDSLLYQLFSLFFLLVLIVLLIHLNRITIVSIPIVDNGHLEATDKDKFYRGLAWDYYKSFEYNNYVIDYLIDVLRASYRVLMLTVIIISATYVVTLNTKNNNETEVKASYTILNSCECPVPMLPQDVSTDESELGEPTIEAPDLNEPPKVNENGSENNQSMMPDTADTNRTVPVKEKVGEN